MMRIQVDPRSGIPIYVQLVEQVQQLVLQGELKPGDQLPTVRQLATDLRVNFNTVARAYRLLDEARLISTQQGRGTYILEVPSPEDAARLREQAIKALAQRYIADASRMGCTREELITVLQDELINWASGEIPGVQDNQ